MDNRQDYKMEDESLKDVTGGVRNTNGVVGPSSFRCFCGKTFTNSSSWKTHIASCKTYQAKTDTVFVKKSE